MSQLKVLVCPSVSSDDLRTLALQPASLAAVALTDTFWLPAGSRFPGKRALQLPLMMCLATVLLLSVLFASTKVASRSVQLKSTAQRNAREPRSSTRMSTIQSG